MDLSRPTKLEDFLAKDAMHFPMTVMHRDYGTQGITPHSHDFLEIVFVVKGSGTTLIDGRRWPISRGDVYIINLGSVHSYTAVQGFEYYDILVAPDFFSPKELRDFDRLKGFWELFFLESLFRKEENFQSRLHLSPGGTLKIDLIVQRIYCELQEKRNGYEILCKGYFLALLAELCRHYTRQIRNEKREAIIAGRKQAVARVVEYIEGHYADSFDMQSLASLAYLSSSHFRSVFRKHVGLSPLEFLNRYRIDKAKDLLVKTNLNITEIAYQVGFHDAGYFTRMFRKAERKTPIGFRRDVAGWDGTRS
jgi:AraC-like DNA-binding protein